MFGASCANCAGKAWCRAHLACCRQKQSEAAVLMVRAKKGYSELMEYADNAHIPISVMMELTNNCNQRCVYCYNAKKREPELSTLEIKSAIRQLEKLGTLFLSFTGGEVLTRPDFFEIARYARKRGFGIRILTNASLIDEGTADKIAGLNPIAVEISLFSPKPEIHDAITQTPGSLQRTLGAMRLLKKRKVRVVAKSTFMRQNAKELYPVWDYCRKKKFGFSCGAIITPKHDGSKSPCAYRLAGRELAAWYDGVAGRLNPATLRAMVRHERTKLPVQVISCSAGKSVCCISAYGDVYPCIEMPSMSGGNIREKSIGEIWQSSQAFREAREMGKQVLEPCSSCLFKLYCNFCAGMRLLEGGDIYKPLAEGCRHAKANRGAILKTLAINERNNNGKRE